MQTTDQAGAAIASIPFDGRWAPTLGGQKIAGAPTFTDYHAAADYAVRVKRELSGE